MRVAVVGHVEHIEFLRVTRVPQPGEIAHATETWQEAAGGGGVAAVQLAKLAGSCALFTALGDDDLGRAVPGRLARFDVTVHAAFRARPQRRGFTYLDDDAERTITVIGQRDQPEADDPLPFASLADMDAVYVTAGGPEVLRLARRARVVVATARVLPLIEASGVQLDAIVRSARDVSEPDPVGMAQPPKLVVATEGALGGSYRTHDGVTGRFAASPLPGPPVDAYGCGDSFAAGLTFALGAGLGVEDALAFASTCGAACLTGRAPFGGQRALAADDPLRVARTSASR